MAAQVRLLLPQVFHPHRLALRARHLAVRPDLDLAGDADARLDMPHHVRGRLAAPTIIGGHAGRHFDLHRHRIERAVARENDLIVWGDARETDQERLHLRWIHIDTADDHHVVVPAGNAHDTDMGPATAAVRAR